jgi:hypothetical protein
MTLSTLTDSEQLLAIEAITRLKARYFRCMDTGDWAGFLAVFTPDATIDESEAMTPTDHAGRRVAVDGVPAPAPNPALRYDHVEDFVANVAKAFNGASAVHHGHMPEIVLTSATTATGVWSLEDVLRWPKGCFPQNMQGFGHYWESYVRLPGGWRIKTLRLTRLRIEV